MRSRRKWFSYSAPAFSPSVGGKPEPAPASARSRGTLTSRCQGTASVPHFAGWNDHRAMTTAAFSTSDGKPSRSSESST